MDISNFCQDLTDFKLRYGHTYVPPYPEFSDLYQQSVFIKENPGKAPRCLRELAFPFEADNYECRWMFNYYLLRQHVRDHGNDNISNLYRENRRLYTWILRQRQQAASLSPTRKAMLDDINFSWDRSSSAFWEQMFKMLKRFYKKHGHTQVPSSYVNQQLSEWVIRQRRFSDKLTDDQQKRLTDLGFQFDMPRQRDLTFEVYFNLLKKFKEDHGHTNVTTYYPNKKLFNWVRSLRQNEEKLEDTRHTRLKSIGFEFMSDKAAKRAQKWREQYELVAESLRLTNKLPDDERLQNWYFRQKARKANVTEEEKALLKKIGIILP
ncbi:MAG: helicase associated domain-containing protein [Bacteroidota bacterium]